MHLTKVINARQCLCLFPRKHIEETHETICIFENIHILTQEYLREEDWFPKFLPPQPEAYFLLFTTLGVLRQKQLSIKNLSTNQHEIFRKLSGSQGDPLVKKSALILQYFSWPQPEAYFFNFMYYLLNNLIDSQLGPYNS